MSYIDRVIAQGPFRASWESLKQYSVPAWYEDAKFGIFIHWGVYAVPAFGNEWYPRNMYVQGTPEFDHHVATYGPQAQFGYKDFIPQFKAEQYDPAAWADLFKRAGARFVVPVAEHHDGFAMYNCSFSRWTAAKMGPHRDLIGELAAAVRKEGMVFGVSSHRAEHWWFFNGGMAFDSDVQDPRLEDLYGPAMPVDDITRSIQNRGLARNSSTTGWRAPASWWTNISRNSSGLIGGSSRRCFRPTCRNLPPITTTAAMNGIGRRHQPQIRILPEGAAVFDIERGQLKEIRPLFWQNDTSVAKNSWGHVEPQEYKDRDIAHPRSGRRRQQERGAAAQHRAAARRHDPRTNRRSYWRLGAGSR